MKVLILLTILISMAYAHNQNNGKKSKVGLEVNPTRGQPWPMPQQYVAEPSFFTINPTKFNFTYSGKCDIILEAIKRYSHLMFLDDCSKKSKNEKNIEIKSLGEMKTLSINVQGPCEKYPYMNMDEQYLLKVNTLYYENQSLLYSVTVWGALRGLETFSHLVYNLKPGVFAINTSIVLDYPRFPFRGLLLDTSRHFIPVPILLQNLDAMSQTKLNVFHWHIVDDQSFPYVSKKFPDLSEKGAFNPKTHTYSQAEIASVIEYARLRGIRVLVEFDSPGHTLSWGKAQPNILTSCYAGDFPNGKYGPLDPTKSDTFTFLKSFLEEIAEVFPDNFLHLGGDEVSFDCWATNPIINSFMQSHGFGKNYALLEQYYMQELLDIVKSLNKSYIVWQEVFDNGVKVKPDTVIHVWKDGYQLELSNVTSAGFNTILSSCWYLNYINYGDDWTTYYGCDPHNFEGSEKQKNLVLGGEACMWGEYVDGSNVITRTWPRAAAVAERLWSNKTQVLSKETAPRLEELRCNMIKRGLKVEPVNGPGFCECDYLM